jgi:hypothetical protein
LAFCAAGASRCEHEPKQLLTSLLIITVFVVVFLAIHPFQDGNLVPEPGRTLSFTRRESPESHLGTTPLAGL